MNIADIDKTVGLNVTQFCQNYTTQTENHCAHYVCHLLGLSFGYTCVSFKGNHGSPAASIRVHELFRQCDEVGPWGARPANLVTCLIFVTRQGELMDFKNKKFTEVPDKHVGVFTKAVQRQDMAAFDAHMTHAYQKGKRGIIKAYGTIPPLAAVRHAHHMFPRIS